MVKFRSKIGHFLPFWETALVCLMSKFCNFRHFLKSSLFVANRYFWEPFLHNLLHISEGSYVQKYTLDVDGTPLYHVSGMLKFRCKIDYFRSSFLNIALAQSRILICGHDRRGMMKDLAFLREKDLRYCGVWNHKLNSLCFGNKQTKRREDVRNYNRMIE